MDEPLIAVLVLLSFPVAWMIMLPLMARVGGWARLAEHYEARDDFEGQRWRFESARFNRRVNYGGCLTFGANARGLHLSTWILFRPGHPALFIPWSDVTMKKTTYWMFPYVELSFRRAPERPLLIRQKLGQHLATAAGLPWPPPEAK